MRETVDIYFSEDEPMLYYIDTTVESFLSFLSLCIHCQTKFARVPRGNDNGLTVSGEEYDFVGDLQSVIPLGPHGEGSFITVTHPPYVHLSGLALNCKKDEATFTLDIDLWVSSLIKTEQKPARRASAPFLCHIADSPKYKNSTKPTPYEKRFVTVHGYITGVIYNNPQDSDQGIERYIVTVKLIDFLGGLAEPSGGKEGSMIPNKLDTSTPRKGFGSFRYGSNSKSPLTTGMQPPSTPSPTLNGSGLLSNKRRRVGDDKNLAGTPDPEPSLGQSEKASETDEKGKKRAT